MYHFFLYKNHQKSLYFYDLKEIKTTGIKNIAENAI